ncbi:MAG TPA: hypothetical protein VK066_13255 [Chloroflexota bacterium]|nr:hypothetical protein [Chloroflexota bacterium]
MRWLLVLLGLLLFLALPPLTLAQSYGYGYYGSSSWSSYPIGNTTYYYGINPYWSGYSTRIGNSTYYTVNNRLSGYSNRVGNYTYYHWNNGLNGSSTRIGDYTYYNWNTGSSNTCYRIGSWRYCN